MGALSTLYPQTRSLVTADMVTLYPPQSALRPLDCYSDLPAPLPITQMWRVSEGKVDKVDINYQQSNPAHGELELFSLSPISF